MHPYRSKDDFKGLYLRDFNIADVLRDTGRSEVKLYTGKDKIYVGRDLAEVLDKLRTDDSIACSGTNVTGRDMGFSGKVKKMLELKTAGVIKISREDLQTLSSRGLVLQDYGITLGKGEVYDSTIIIPSEEIDLKELLAKSLQCASEQYGFPVIS